jgi:hypothetical protein
MVQWCPKWSYLWHRRVEWWRLRMSMPVLEWILLVAQLNYERPLLKSSSKKYLIWHLHTRLTFANFFNLWM